MPRRTGGPEEAGYVPVYRSNGRLEYGTWRQGEAVEQSVCAVRHTTARCSEARNEDSSDYAAIAAPTSGRKKEGGGVGI
jgi:hypothetical protein